MITGTFRAWLRMRVPADSNHPDAIVPESIAGSGGSSGNYFDTIAALAKKHGHGREQATMDSTGSKSIATPLSAANSSVASARGASTNAVTAAGAVEVIMVSTAIWQGLIANSTG